MTRRWQSRQARSDRPHLRRKGNAPLQISEVAVRGISPAPGSQRGKLVISLCTLYNTQYQAADDARYVYKRGDVLDQTASMGPNLMRRKRPVLEHLRELVESRELILNLTIRELKARYKSSALGFLWSLLNPLGMMLVFTFVFTVMWPNSQMEKYPLFLLCGLLPWNFFSAGVMTSINSIVGNANLVKKVYFPRGSLPISTVLANLVNFLLGLVVLFAVLVVFRARFSPWLWLLPVVILIQTCFILGIAFILSAANVYYRDTIMIMDTVMLAWFFLTPVVYPITNLPTSYTVLGVTLNVHRLVYILNPMASLIAAYRDLLYWGYRTDMDFLLRTAVTSLAILAFGYWVFVRFSGRFGEEV